MTASTPTSNIGRHVFGVAALALGLITLAWHDYSAWHQQRYIAYAAAAAQIFGGAAIQFRRTEDAGAVVLGGVYLVSTLLCVPGIVATPQIYNSWGNFFERELLEEIAPAIVDLRCGDDSWHAEQGRHKINPTKDDCARILGPTKLNRSPAEDLGSGGRVGNVTLLMPGAVVVPGQRDEA